MKRTLVSSVVAVALVVGLAGCFGKCDKECRGVEHTTEAPATETNVDAQEAVVTEAPAQEAVVAEAAVEVAPVAAEEVK